MKKEDILTKAFRTDAFMEDGPLYWMEVHRDEKSGLWDVYSCAESDFLEKGDTDLLFDDVDLSRALSLCEKFQSAEEGKGYVSESERVERAAFHKLPLFRAVAEVVLAPTP